MTEAQHRSGSRKGNILAIKAEIGEMHYGSSLEDCDAGEEDSFGDQSQPCSSGGRVAGGCRADRCYGDERDRARLNEIQMCSYSVARSFSLSWRKRVRC